MVSSSSSGSKSRTASSSSTLDCATVEQNARDSIISMEDLLLGELLESCPPKLSENLNAFCQIRKYSKYHNCHCSVPTVEQSFDLIYLSYGEGIEIYCHLLGCLFISGSVCCLLCPTFCLPLSYTSCVLGTISLSVYTFLFYKHQVYKHAQPQIFEKSKHKAKHAPG